ncbi:MAG: cyanophycin synthetase, partial [bacterium]|nr:cyanophycin synthetase [bacterium]
PGRYNLLNSTAAIVASYHLGVDLPKLQAGLKAYQGSLRRFEFIGRVKGISLYDDYAHHPTEIKATLTGAKDKFPDSKIICVFQPHQTKRLKLLFRDITESFNDADILILLPPYQVAGRDNDDLQYNSEALFKAIQKKSPKKEIYYLQSPANLKKIIEEKVISRKLLVKKFVLIMMGAGNIADLTEKLI